MCEKYTFARYQGVAMSTAVYPVVGHPVVYPILGLCGEAGEASEKVKKALRSGVDMPREEILKELGDVLWYITAAAKELGYSLEDVARVNVTKILDRRARGVVKGEGDNR